jgi:transcription termination factor Rho
MKKLSTLFFFSFLAFVLFTTNLQAQSSPEDYFVGSWNVKAFGLPQGDTQIIIQIEKKEGKLGGGIVDATTNQINPFTKVEVAANKLTAYFTAQGMDVYLSLEKKDDKSVTGSIMDMFNMEGTKGK